MQQDETQPNEYPRGRGYGHDYMRGGEVFNGYGYKDRDEYQRTRGGESTEDSEGEVNGDAAEPPREGLATGATDAAREASPSGADDTDAPVPHIEHTYGSAGSQRNSRSLYVTQAQLQQRVYRPHEQS